MSSVPSADKFDKGRISADSDCEQTAGGTEGTVDRLNEALICDVADAELLYAMLDHHVRLMWTPRKEDLRDRVASILDKLRDRIRA